MKIAVIGGGSSLEAEVSRSSAKQVMAALDTRYDTAYFELDAALHAHLDDYAPDVVFPVLHGVPGEDGSVQGFLEVMRLPFVGSGMAASALAIDKFQAKRVWETLGMPVLPMKLLSKPAWSAEACADVTESLGTSLAIKPRCEGSALGVKLLPDGGDVNGAVQQAFVDHAQLIVEPFTAGREITVAVLERRGRAEALPIIEIQVLAEGEWYDFTNRYTKGASRHVIEPELASDTAVELKRLSILAHESLGCRDFSRVDFILDEDNHPWLLEINTIPGMTPTSLFPDAARAAGIQFPQLLDLLIDNATTRSRNT